mmetsp:Transcript_4218/g.5721  ORF Transcript_4218/g.5721 Transcript_4218/m.5721 type:complete len:92 (-) Transcript_4218:776-1051(-)
MVEIVTEKVGTENFAVNTTRVEAEVPAAGMFGAEPELDAESEAEVAAANTFGADTELVAASKAHEADLYTAYTAADVTECGVQSKQMVTPL